MWLGMPAVAEKTQLPSVQPLEHIHAMARGPLAAAGGLYEADMTIDALRSVGSERSIREQRARLRLLVWPSRACARCRLPWRALVCV